MKQKFVNELEKIRYQYGVTKVSDYDKKGIFYHYKDMYMYQFLNTPIASINQNTGLTVDDIQNFCDDAWSSYWGSLSEDTKNIKVSILGLRNRGYYALIRAGIKTIPQLLECTDRKLLSLRNFGNVSLNDVKNCLALYNLSLLEE